MPSYPRELDQLLLTFSQPFAPKICSHGNDDDDNQNDGIKKESMIVQSMLITIELNLVAVLSGSYSRLGG
jgi:hypothetical protein